MSPGSWDVASFPDLHISETNQNSGERLRKHNRDVWTAILNIFEWGLKAKPLQYSEVITMNL